MSIHSPTLTIGIPAYNEEGNIQKLLLALLAQRANTFVLKQILVNSDGSSDRTVQIVKQVAKKDRRVKIMENSDRRGASLRQNQIISRTETDILILLNADVLPVNNTLLDLLIGPIANGIADMTTPRLIPVPPKTFIERILYRSVHFKNSLYEAFREGNNMYTCRGTARAFSKKLYKILTFPAIADEDAYSYLFAKTKGFRYEYVPTAQVVYKLPDNLGDHRRQSVRFFSKKIELKKLFGDKAVKKAYRLPRDLTVKSLFREFLIDPVAMIFYVGISVLMKISAYAYKPNRGIWDTAQSSKRITCHE